jgi:CelD/BcsL family acetyltransferase involved in cellulose biosynthesis
MLLQRGYHRAPDASPELFGRIDACRLSVWVRPVHLERLRRMSRKATTVTDVTVTPVPATDPDVLAAWRDLQADGGVGTPFLSWQWAEALAAVPEIASKIQVLRVEAGGRTVGLFPVERWSGDAGVSVVGTAGQGWMGADHLDVVAAPDMRTAVADAVAAFLFRDRSWELLDIDGLARDGALAAALGRRRPATVVRLPDRDVTAPFVDLRARDPLLLLPSRNLRQQVSRGLRSAEKSGGGLSVCSSPDDVPDALAVLMELHQERFGTRSAIFSTDERRRFHLEVGRRLAEHGMVRVYQLRMEGTDAALLYALRLEDRLYYYNMGLRPDVGGSPGRTLLGQVLLSSAAEGMTELDLLRGDHGFKLRFATGERVDLHLRLLRPTPRTLLMAARRAAGRLRRRRAEAEAAAGPDPLPDEVAQRVADPRP